MWTICMVRQGVDVDGLSEAGIVMYSLSLLLKLIRRP